MADNMQQDSNSTNQDPKDMKGMTEQFEGFLQEYLVQKAPFHIPAGGKEFIVAVIPYIVLIMAVLMIFSVIGLLSALGLMGAMFPLYTSMGMVGLGVWQPLWFLSTALSIVAAVMQISVWRGLKNREHSAWKMMYYASLVSFASSLAALSIIPGIIGSTIGWYILFQVKESYKN